MHKLWGRQRAVSERGNAVECGEVHMYRRCFIRSVEGLLLALVSYPGTSYTRKQVKPNRYLYG